MSDSQYSNRRRRHLERNKLDLLRALAGDLAPRHAQDPMAYPFFSLAQSKPLSPTSARPSSGQQHGAGE
jgi:plasmid replication initiation protein